MIWNKKDSVTGVENKKKGKKKKEKKKRTNPTRYIPFEKKINGDTPHPHRAISELIFKHFTVLYIEDIQQKVFYGVMEGMSFTK